MKQSQKPYLLWDSLERMARSQAIPGCTAQRICCGSPHWADGVMGFMERLEAQRDGKEVSTKVSLVLLSCPHEQGRAVPSEPEPGVCRATLLTAAHLAAWAGASPGRQCWLVLPKAGGQDAVTACSYGRGSRPRLPGGKVRAPGRGGVWSRADLVPSVSLCRRSLSQLLASFRLPATLSGGGMGAIKQKATASAKSEEGKEHKNLARMLEWVAIPFSRGSS